jgi:hypothetical protein
MREGRRRTEVILVLEERRDALPGTAEREIRLYLSYAEANVVRTKLAYLLGDRATVSRLTSVTGGWAFTISRTRGNDRTGSRISEIERSP